MEDQNSWKGHTFTLMIFGGIVVLCAIFFVLGMIVGRMQGVRTATVAAAEAAGKSVIKEAVVDTAPELRLPERADAAKLSLPEVVVAKPEPPARPTPKVDPPAAAARSAVSLQIGAWSKQTEAEKQLRELKRRGFARAFILSPAPAEAKPVYRVQVAVADLVEADSVKQKLETAGYKPIIKK
jgi:cell division septation protein DedD